MIPAEPMPNADPNVGVEPTVRLVSMTPDPLGTVAKVLMLADGRVYRVDGDCSDSDRRHYWEQSLKTHLRAPWEFIDMHFIFEGVPRWWTQQLERQRTATYFEQSLRFAVVEDLESAVSFPPSLGGTVRQKWSERRDAVSSTQNMRNIWDDAVQEAETAYMALIEHGMPAEDARGLLPLATCTRVHYHTNLRALAEHAGNRLCTQASFLWRVVFAKIISEIRTYWEHPESVVRSNQIDDGWQFEAIANSAIFRPVCYSLGSCPWGADFDRGCKIRDRVAENAAAGRPSSEWGRSDGVNGIPAIEPAEWLADEGAARFK
jgi:flavin-dependent thymidylate synthase